MFPYTMMSLNKKNCLCFGFFLHSLVSTPSPTRTLDGLAKDFPDDPKHVSTWLIRRALISVLASLSTIVKIGLTAQKNKFVSKYNENTASIPQVCSS
uniref:Lactoylglutathione lyase-like n=1 Tax=Phallusia mammillata TaxID=59560 RepID=A0A6F9DE69_9ASCI|nr:lactoylglutathione lyase-like [Phallusia mammillata]